MGVWIEIFLPPIILFRLLSLPSWECGLKSVGINSERVPWVTPFMGVWIEIASRIRILCLDIVTPFMGVWIEIIV